MSEGLFTEADWKLFRKKLPEWQENYMGELIKEYAAILADRKDVAQGVGVTLGKYDKWEAGMVLPKAGDVDRLSEFYGISIDEMLEIGPEESAAINRQIIADAEHLPPELKENVLGIMKGSHPELFPNEC